jgi:hypothetical protein
MLTFLYSNNPKPYAALGNVIYENVQKIDSLQKLKSYDLYKSDIAKYVKEVELAKKEGFEIEASKAKISKKDYLIKLRHLAKINDNYLRGIRDNYKASMNNNNYNLFSEIINCGLIDTNKNKNEIIDYYYKHQEDINASGVIEDLLNDDAKLKALKESQKIKYKIKKILEEEKLKRIRDKEKTTQENLEVKLQNELQNELQNQKKS